MRRALWGGVLFGGVLFPLYPQKGSSIGVVIGEPTAFVGRFSIGGPSYIEGGLGVSIVEEEIWVHGMYVHYLSGFFAKNIPLYVGGGLALGGVKKGVGIGPRALLGVEFFPEKYPLSVFLEVSLHILIGPEAKVGGGLGIGGRYWF